MPFETTGGISLIKFDGPFLVHTGKRKEQEDPYQFCRPTNVSTQKWNPDPNALALCSDTASPKKEMEEVLDTIVAPMVWEEESRTWKQVVSREPAKRSDIVYLHRALDHMLTVRQARPTGICPIRRELFAQAFGELIRQVTIGSPERGLLLLRVRDEMQMTLSSYQALNDNSSAYGMTREKDQEMHRRHRRKFKRLENEKNELEREAKLLRQELILVNRAAEEQKISDDRRHSEKMQFLKRVYQLLRQKHEGLLKAKIENDNA